MKFPFFQFLFYTGSWIRPERYTPLLEKLSSPTVLPARPILFHPLANASSGADTILIGHSLGGYVALLDAIRYPEKVAGVILLNSHFNTRGSMPYPRVNSDLLSCPVLTLLGQSDERLPIQKGLDDLFDDLCERRINRHVVVHPGRTHFSGIADNDTRALSMVVEDIQLFVESLEKKDMSGVYQRCRGIEKRLSTRLDELTDHMILTSRPANFLDGMLHITMPRALWKGIHWCLFLSSKPDARSHFMHEDEGHVLWKGAPGDMDRIRTAAQKWKGDDKFQLDIYTLPTIHPAILAWLSLPLFPRRLHGILRIPVLALPVNQNTTYYKIPHPHRLVSQIADEISFSAQEERP